ncbi:hypothetical protein AHMF7605_21465 [Adhaeribacter arboris]|uniref:Uncharacterized protein n=1 Tax=Adhaeribacter arboris TaxID=2072846 RepID=A0A2T2YK89_9BACT|nr:hypothetical protein [Adhaeribacter arboris]PSR55885.1 hypothetical protein AHMF7605_21465 [Adhaeribacter arboris]
MADAKIISSFVNFKTNEGPITIEVTSGFASLGTFILSCSKVDDFDFKEFGKDPKRIDDSILDIFQVPIDLKVISKYEVAILGKYAPAPGHEQIKVNYKFIQNNKELVITPPGSNIIEEKSDEPFKRYTNFFKFEENG